MKLKEWRASLDIWGTSNVPQKSRGETCGGPSAHHICEQLGAALDAPGEPPQICPGRHTIGIESCISFISLSFCQQVPQGAVVFPPTKTWRCGHYGFFQLYYCGDSDLLQKGEWTAGRDDNFSNWYIEISLNLSFSTQRVQRGGEKTVQNPSILITFDMQFCINWRRLYMNWWRYMNLGIWI